MKKLLYIGHEYHLKTKSTVFLVDLLKESYEVNLLTFNPYINQFGNEFSDDMKNKKYDVLVCFQILPDKKFLDDSFNYNQGVFFPMYDHYITNSQKSWESYREFKIINFSKTLHEEFLEKGYNSYYIQYFPKPVDNFEWGNDRSIFFWQRLQFINIKTIEVVFKNIQIEKIHIHKALDPLQNFVEPENHIKDIVSYSDWFEKSSDKNKIVEESSFYMAPRIYEGIGMSFLEAMAMGRCVIAPDYPTMNEYIQHGITGYLYDYNNVQPIEISNIRKIQKAAYEYVVNGYKKWEVDKHKICEWIKEERKKPKVTIVTVTYNIIENNRLETFIQCMESVHRQNYSNIEHLVIDGASFDGTVDILDKYCKKGWITYYSKKDSGMYQAMNRGIGSANGKYIAFLNTDDYYHNYNAVDESVRFLENSKADFSYALNRLVSEDDIWYATRKPQIGSFVAQMPFCHQTMFTKKDALLEIGKFNEKYRSAADYDIVMRLLMNGFEYVEVPFSIVSYRSGGISEKMQEQSDREKKEIFCTNYGALDAKYNEIKTAEFLAGRICPISLYESLQKKVTKKLWFDMQQAVSSVDNDKQIYKISEEIIVPEEFSIPELSEIIIFDNFEICDLEHLIQNIVLQSYSNIELVIISKKNDDNLQKAIDKYNQQIKIVYFPEGYENIQDAFRKAIQLSNGNIINFLSVKDEYISDDVVEKIMKMFECSLNEFICTNLENRDNILQTVYEEIPIQHFYIKKDILKKINFNSKIDLAELIFSIKLGLLMFSNVGEVTSIQAIIIYEKLNNLIMRELFSIQLIDFMEKSFKNKLNKNKIADLEDRHLTDGNIVAEMKLKVNAMEENNQRLKRRVDKFVDYFNILNQWLYIKNNKKSILEFFNNNNINKIAIYGMGELGNRLYEELRDTNIEIKYAIESKKIRLHVNLDVYLVSENLSGVDAIIVTPTFAFDEIKQELIKKVDCQIISLSKVIFSIR